MTQDTRRDKRAKIVSLNVRYKSATVDEFIENHSHDISKGGIYVKTPTPFPPGTLLKFEIRLAGDKTVIAGVGRVVWKREPSQASAERPAGMGVKFIKIDDSSRGVIDKLVGQKADAGAAFTSEPDAPDASPRPVGAYGSPTPKGMAATPGAPAPVPRPQVQPYVRKNTNMGIGPITSPPPADAPAVPRPAAGTPAVAAAPQSAPEPAAAIPPAAKTDRMFPDTGPDSESEPAKERTVMKQAAELLEEALREAGGSMEEIGTNPLFDQVGKQSPRQPTSDPHPADDEVASGGTIIMANRPRSAPPPAAEPSPPPASLGDRSSYGGAPAPVSTPAPPSSIRPPILERQTQRSSNTGLYVALAVVLLGGGGAVAAWQLGVFGGGPVTTTTSKPTPTLSTPTSATASAPIDAAVTTPAAEDAAAASTAVVATGAPDAAADAKATTPATTATTTTAPVFTARPTATATATSTPTATATATSTATSTATATATTTATATSTATSTPTATATATATDTPTATATATATTKPKPPPTPTSDNPY